MKTPKRSATKSARKFVVLGPDGIPVRGKPFATREAAERALADFVARFRLQGYYAGAGFRLKLDEIATRCSVRECVAGDDSVSRSP